MICYWASNQQRPKNRQTGIRACKNPAPAQVFANKRMRGHTATWATNSSSRAHWEPIINELFPLRARKAVGRIYVGFWRRRRRAVVGVASNGELNNLRVCQQLSAPHHYLWVHTSWLGSLLWGLPFRFTACDRRAVASCGSDITARRANSSLSGSIRGNEPEKLEEIGKNTKIWSWSLVGRDDYGTNFSVPFNQGVSPEQ